MSVVVNDALSFAIYIYLKLRKEIGISISFDNFMDEESIVVFELSFWAFNIKNYICDVLDFFNIKSEKKRLITCCF